MIKKIPKPVCTECGSPLVKVNGMVCPNGHGRIHPRPVAEMVDTKEQLPKAEYAETRLVWCRYLSIYLIYGQPGEYRTVRRWLVGHGRDRHSERTPGEIVRARLDGRATQFVRIEEEGK